jgi:hypothetical protein
MILDGTKTWEIRGSCTSVRGKIALIRGGSGLIVGRCELVDVVGPLTHQQLMDNSDKTGIVPAQVQLMPYDKPHAWVLKNVDRFDVPRRYKHPPGAVIWVRLRHS